MASYASSVSTYSTASYRTTSWAESPASYSSECFPDYLDQHEFAMAADDVSTTMEKVLGYLERVVDHLRDKDCNDVANSIAKHTVLIVKEFNTVTADWDAEKCRMQPARVAPATPNISTAGPSRPTQTGQQSSAVSWAAVAATAVPHRSKIIKHTPEDGIKRFVMLESPDPLSLRVLWVRPWDISRRHCREVTEQIQEGPLLSIAYSAENQAICIVFQHASHAHTFFQVNKECYQRKGHGLFGPGVETVAGQPMPKNDALSRMEAPFNERRRLTFARQRLFADGTTEGQFKRDIFEIVGQHNVELVWLFNSGNATVVFSSTSMARAVMEEFRRRAQRPGPYQGVQVSYSHDPCERPMHLISQMAPDRSCAKVVPRAMVSNAPKRRGPSSKTDDDGWQKVVRRK